MFLFSPEYYIRPTHHYSPTDDYVLSICSSDKCFKRDTDILQCCDNINESNFTTNRKQSRHDNSIHSQDSMECPFSACGCNYRTIDSNQLNIHNQENVQKHMNVSKSQLY